MPHLEVPGASLYYETVGEGPLFLCISGANGSADLWKPMAKRLSTHFKVATYDRRGFSRSMLLGAQDYEHRLETDADDAERLIRHLSPHDDEPATVLGNSSGGIIALELLIRHPDAVRTLIAHEPPAMKLLPDFEKLMSTQRDIYQTYRKSGIAPGINAFAQFIMAGDETAGLLRSFDPKVGPYVFSNTMYWFERELPYYLAHSLDLQALKMQQNKLLLLNGRESNHEAPQYRVNAVLSEKFGIELHLMPGAHVGFAIHAAKFAKAVWEILQDKDSSY